MGEPVMTETATLSLGGIEGWDGSQRSERDTLIRADQSKHHNPPEEPSYLKSTIASRNRAYGSTCAQCSRDADGRHWHSDTTTTRPWRYTQSLSTTGSRSKGRNSSIRGQLLSRPGRSDLIPNAGLHELPSNSTHSQSQQPQNLTIDLPQVELEGANDGATLNGTTQKNAIGISHDDPEVLPELPGITNGTNVNEPQPPAQNPNLPNGGPGSSLQGDDQPDNTPNNNQQSSEKNCFVSNWDGEKRFENRSQGRPGDIKLPRGHGMHLLGKKDPAARD